MRQFYISDPALFDIKIDALDFKLYEYFKYFQMPRYKYFLENIQFRKNFSSKGWRETQKQAKTSLNGVYE